MICIYKYTYQFYVLFPSGSRVFSQLQTATKRPSLRKAVTKPVPSKGTSPAAGAPKSAPLSAAQPKPKLRHQKSAQHAAAEAHDAWRGGYMWVQWGIINGKYHGDI